MNKIILSLAGVLAAVAFAPEASAVPSFARQTGMACNACHFQSFPALTSFGRAFKASGYTTMGAQGKVEGEHGLSLPGTLNSSVYIQWRYAKTTGPSPDTGAGASTNYGRWDMPDEMALFVGGRVSEDIGFLTELGTAGAVALANVKMPVLFDAGSMKVGFIPFSSSGIGAAYGYDVFATGSSGAGRITENGMGYGAALYMGSTNDAGSATSDATGFALVALNQDFHVNLTKYTGAGAGGSYTKLGGTYLRAAWTPTIGNWDVGVGVQNWSGDPTATAATVPASTKEAKLMIIDGQAQGEVSGMPMGLYASYGTASATDATATVANIYNAGAKSKTALGLMADLWVMPSILGVQLGMMRANTGLTDAAGAAETDNSITLGARYKLRQNVKLGFAYTKFSGSAYETGGSGGANTANYGQMAAGGMATGRGTGRMTFILSAGI